MDLRCDLGNRNFWTCRGLDTVFREASAMYAANLVSAHQPIKEKKKSKSDDSDSDDDDTDPDVRRGLLETFAARFGFNIPTFLQASDKIIDKLAKQRKKKMVRFFPLADLATVCDAKTRYGSKTFPLFPSEYLLVVLSVGRRPRGHDSEGQTGTPGSKKSWNGFVLVPFLR